MRSTLLVGCDAAWRMSRLLAERFEAFAAASKTSTWSCRKACHYVAMASGSETINNHAAFIWSVADLLRGDYKQSEYGKVILPLTVLRRLDCVLEPIEGRRCSPSTRS